MTARDQQLQLIREIIDEKFNTWGEKLKNIESGVDQINNTLNGVNGKKGLIERMQTLENFRTDLIARVGVFMLLGWVSLMLFGQYIQKAVASIFR